MKVLQNERRKLSFLGQLWCESGIVTGGAMRIYRKALDSKLRPIFAIEVRLNDMAWEVKDCLKNIMKLHGHQVRKVLPGANFCTTYGAILLKFAAD